MFPPTVQIFGPTGGWIHVTDQLTPGLLAQGVFFETLTLGYGPGFGADYYLDNAVVTAPEPGSMAVLGAAMLSLVGMARRRRD